MQGMFHYFQSSVPGSVAPVNAAPPAASPVVNGTVSSAAVRTLTNAQKKAIRQVPAWNPEGSIKGRDFIQHYERVLRSEQATDLQILSNIGLHLQGMASTWLSTLEVEDNSALKDWMSFKELMRRTWDPRPAPSTSLATFMNCRIEPGESIQTHMIRFARCVMDLDGQMNPFQLKLHYLNLLRPATAESLRHSHATQLNDIGPMAWTYSQVAAVAAEYEERQGSGRLHSSARPVQTSAPVAFSSAVPAATTVAGLINEARKRKNAETTSSPSSASSFIRMPPLQLEPGMRDLSNVTCFNCGGKGHYATNCKQPRAEIVPERPVMDKRAKPEGGA
jgi:hypothetical protein